MANMLLNPSFETYNTIDPTATWAGVQAGQTYLNDWVVGGSGIDLIGGYWQPHSGACSVDMAGSGSGYVEQDVATVIGARYRISCWMAPTPSFENRVGEIRVNGSLLRSVTLSSSVLANSVSDMKWGEYSVEFVADSAVSTVRFADNSGGSAGGMAIDDVSMERVSTGRFPWLRGRNQA